MVLQILLRGTEEISVVFKCYGVEINMGLQVSRTKHKRGFTSVKG